jgi:hypothetical protein
MNEKELKLQRSKKKVSQLVAITKQVSQIIAVSQK